MYTFLSYFYFNFQVKLKPMGNRARGFSEK